MGEKIKCITICMGSSCFSRGNKKLVSFTRDFLKDHKLDELIILKGDHCMGKCSEGPVVMIDDQTFLHTSEATLEQFLDKSNKIS